jgi:hypothetical protein
MRLELHHDFDRALVATTLPEPPDYEAGNRFLLRAGSQQANGAERCRKDAEDICYR